MAPPDLQGLRVLLTRPHPHNDKLQARLAALGAEVRILPMMSIEPLPDTPALRQCIMNLDLYRILIVVSPNAARIGLAWIDRYWPQLPVGIDWFAVGQGSAAVLAEYGIQAQAPNDGHDSEALLRLPRLQQVAGERVLILRGDGGRELLAETLRGRGAQVDYAELYRRTAPQWNRAELEEALAQFDPQAVLLFSGETCDHLLSLCRQQGIDLSGKQLWLPSERAAEAAHAAGMSRLTVLPSLEEKAIVQALGEWHHRMK